MIANAIDEYIVFEDEVCNKEDIMEQKTIAIITARGGSKRIPRKNIKEFCGKPIIAYSIQAALESGLFEEVMVSTDSEEIADIARQYGASVPFMRSAETSNDFATTPDVVREVISEYEKRGKSFTYACCIYPTAPFLTAEKLCAAMETLKESNAVQLTPVVAFSFPPQRGFVIDDTKRIRYKYPEYKDMRSQDIEKMYHDAGQFYVYDVKRFMTIKGNVSEGIVPFILSEMEVQDIDNEEDWEIAELKYRILHKD